jgi:hypothetical protein
MRSLSDDIAYYVWTTCADRRVCVQCRAMEGLHALPLSRRPILPRLAACKNPRGCRCQWVGVFMTEGAIQTEDARTAKVTVRHQLGGAADIAAFLKGSGGTATFDAVQAYLSSPSHEAEFRLAGLDKEQPLLRGAGCSSAVLAAILLFVWFLLPLAAAEPVRVFITDSASWSIILHPGISGGGARPQTAEIIKTFNQRCPQVIITNAPARADYVVVLDHEGGKHFYRRDNKVAVFRKDGDVVMSHSTRSLGNSVSDACEAVLADAHRWRPSADENAQPAAPQVSPPPAEPAKPAEWEPFGEIKKAKKAEQTPPASKPAGPPAKEIRLGMDFSQVEAVLGPPETRADLGTKVLYKYKDMTVEFRDGKVADVR